MISKVVLDHSTWAEIPHKFEAGTPDISGAIVFGTAIDYLNSVGIAAIHDYEVELTKYAIEKLETVPTLKIYGKAAERGGAVSFAIDGAHPHDISHFVDKDGIAIRAGHMCAQPLLRRYGLNALSRASLYFYNTYEEIDALVVSLEKVRRFFNRGN
jgi:cysteine desulfurase/selenocysteine lyase